MTTTLPTSVTSRGDRAAIWAFVAAGAAIIIATLYFSITRIIEVLSDGPVTVPVNFADGPVASIPVDSGTALAIITDSGTIEATGLPLTSIVPGIAAPVISGITTIVITACLLAVAASILRGKIFSRRNTALVATAGLVGLIGYALANLAQTMLANDVIFWLTNNQVSNLVFTAQPFVFILAGFALAVVGTAFAVGARIQRETEGLI